MIKVLIADDETLVRAGIKAVIPWEENGFEVVGEAWDGQDAYEKILSLHPDILITDIKMPKMDGIELLKKLRDEKIPIRTVILSCFDDFDLVREGMKYGAKDYILKLSIDPEQLLTVLNEIREELNVANSDGDLAIHNQDLKYLFVKKLMKKEFQSEEQVNNVIKNLGLSVSLQKYRLIQLWLGKRVEQDQREGSDLLYNILDQICKRQPGNEIVPMEKEGFLIIHSGKSERRLYMQIAAAMSGYANTRVFFGSSELQSGYQKFEIGIIQSEEALKCAVFYEIGNEIYYHDICREHIPAFTYREEQELFHSLMAGNREKAEMTLTVLLGRMREKLYLCKECFSYIDGILNIYMRAARELDLPARFHGSGLEDFYDDIKSQRTLDGCGKALVRFTEEFAAYVRKIRSAGEREEIFKIKEYVSLHYNENIDLNTAAGLVNMSPSHLSSIFKKETGENFSSYLTEVRMEEAKRLLQDPNLLIYEVAEQTGYANSGYFGKAFKKFFGMTPEEYRKETRNGKDIQEEKRTPE